MRRLIFKPKIRPPHVGCYDLQYDEQREKGSRLEEVWLGNECPEPEPL